MWATGAPSERLNASDIVERRVGVGRGNARPIVADDATLTCLSIGDGP